LVLALAGLIPAIGSILISLASRILSCGLAILIVRTVAAILILILVLVGHLCLR
jgi:hypothetical protein